MSVLNDKLEIMLIPRVYENLSEYLRPGKVLVLYGPRQAGKTTLLTSFLEKTEWRYFFATGDDRRVQDVLSSLSLRKILAFAADYQLIVIDEAQKISRIGEALKMMVDHLPQIRLLVTGSSSFELAGQVGEPLTGRKRTLVLYPISLSELRKTQSPFQLREKLPELLVYGSYPEVLTAEGDLAKTTAIKEITDSYLMKDIFEFEKIKNPKVFFDLLRLLAFQIGHEVSLRELASAVGVDYKTVRRYIDLLKKAFVLRELSGYSGNLRKEISKKSKYFFLDVGVRNALINNFNPLELRNDVGQLWENFLLMERVKKQQYDPLFANNYFWRTYDGKEIDLVEERQGRLFGYEFKYNPRKTPKPPKDWLETYANASYEVITPENCLDFLLSSERKS